MSFCSKCGQKLVEGAKFCSNCGAPANADEADVYETRRKEYAGKIINCPACGEDIPSFTAICPSCGHEINSAKLAPALKEFIDKINECDKIIAGTSKNGLQKKGWKNWNIITRIFWILLNVFTSCIPLVIYLVWPLLRPYIKRTVSPELTLTEKKKTMLIENFVFPNERESVLEALFFIKSKVAFLVSEKINERNIYWIRLWETKAAQLYQKAEILLANDQIAEVAYKEIVVNKMKADKKIKIRAGMGAAIVSVFVVFVLMEGSMFKGVANLLFDSNSSSNIDVAENFEWLTTGLSTELPEINGTSGDISENNDEELDINIEGVSYSQFDTYVASCKEKGFTIDAVRDTDKYSANNSKGYLLKIDYWPSSKELDINLKAPLVGDENFEWPSHALATLLPPQTGKAGTVETANEETLEIMLLDMSSEEVKSYILECEKQGFTIDTEKEDTSFNGFNEDGYKLIISYNEMKAMSITVNAPMKMEEIAWPSSGPAKLIPKPASKEGKISSDYEWAFSVYVADMTIDDFNAYIDQCIDAGFEKDYRSESSFSAYKGEDIDLSVSYEGFNTIRISVYDYSQFG